MKYTLIDPVEKQRLPALKRILTNRGISLDDIQHYLNVDERDNLNPNLMMNMNEGFKMLASHIVQNDKVLIQVDSDCDGFCSAAILINYLNCHFPGFVQNNITYRIHTGKQHGLILETIPKDIKLVIAPDSSSNDYEVHKKLRENGCDVLVLDHHEADMISEDACIINNQLCDYPTKSLCGAGVVYKFCQFIDEKLKTSFADDFLDLVALALVGDMMDLRDFETRYLVTQGLTEIRNPYFKKMASTQSYSIERGGGLNPFGVAFYIAPYVNATIRVGGQDEKLMLFESMIDYRGYEQIPSTKRGCKGQSEMRVEQACRNCVNIKKKQNEARDASLNAIERIIEEKNLLFHKILVIKDKNDCVKPTLTGLVANVIAAKYQRPTLILHKVENEDGSISWAGSGRNYGNSGLENFREFLNETNLVEYATGHASAFGTSINEKDFNDFIIYTDEKLKDFDFTPCYKVDLIYDAKFLDENDILEIGEFRNVWGQGIEEPLVAVENVIVYPNNVKLFKGSTLKITLPSGMSLIRFSSNEEEFESLSDSGLGCISINIVGKCRRNEWNGNINPEIEVIDYEIVDRKKYYF